ncbi:hypothetical protein LU631_03370 [Erwinia tracheiphila]|uniref:hypothetical protein n=1 Tax=Erwinia tracheiphila TaxID=65700 RepID=UPI0003A4180C|nr:hypothetical protein [Erwinia tracheiphila]UIA88468.1 hypothetical protein LU631_03370 [Erwinia tracheiphila]UIA96846.1 hypothetical protein LU633_02045 [Erwinia tracheiphila]
MVNEAIEGAILSSRYHNISLLNVRPAMRIVVRNDWNKQEVALISVGGPGMSRLIPGLWEKGC